MKKKLHFRPPEHRTTEALRSLGCSQLIISNRPKLSQLATSKNENKWKSCLPALVIVWFHYRTVFCCIWDSLQIVFDYKLFIMIILVTT